MGKSLFPYNIRLRPETNILKVQHKFNLDDVYINTGIITGFEKHIPTSNVLRTVNVGYEINHVFLKQKLVASVDIISKYEFTPTIKDTPPLEEFDEFRTNTTFNGVPITSGGDLSFEQANETFDPFGLGDAIANLINALIIIGVVVLVGVIGFYTVRSISRRNKKRDLKDARKLGIV